MSFTLRPQESAFKASLGTLSTAEIVPSLRRALATARPLSFYVGSAALANLTDSVALELFKRGVFVEALPLFREAVAELTTLLGADDHDTLLVASRLGTCLVNLGQNAEALPLSERVLARLTQLQGAEHKQTLFALQQVAGVRRALGDLDGAEALLRQGKATLARLATAAGLSPDAPPPGLVFEWTEMNIILAEVYAAAGKLEDAKLLLQAALATLAGMAPSNVIAGCVTRLSIPLAVVMDVQGDLLGAEQLYRDLLPKVHGTGDYGIVAHNLGLVLQKRGLVTESRKYLDIGLKGSAAGLGADNTSTQLSQQCRSDLESSLRTCAQCGPVADKDVAMKVCSVCKAARYCSPACQRLHWKAHKPECKRIKADNDAVAAHDGAGPSNA